MKTKHSAGVKLGESGSIHLKNKLTPIILRIYVSGSNGGLAVAVEGGRHPESSLKEAPILRYDKQTCDTWQ